MTHNDQWCDRVMGILYSDPIHTVRINGTKSAELDKNLFVQTPGSTAAKETAVQNFLTQGMGTKGFARVALAHVYTLSPLNYVLRIAPEGYKAPPNWWVVDVPTPPGP